MTPICEQVEWGDVTSEWDSLLRKVRPAAGPFLSPQFHSAWWEIFSAGQHLHLFAVRDKGALIGILPFMIRDTTAEFIGDFGVCDYMDFLSAPGREFDVLMGFFNCLDERDVANIDLRGLAHGSPTLKYLPELAKNRGWNIQSAEEAVCPIVPLAADWETYLSSLRKKHRHEIRRKMRHLAEGGAKIELTVYRESSDLLEKLPDFLTLMVESRGDKAAFMTDRMADFFHLLVERLSSEDFVRFYFLSLDGVVVAAVLGLVADRSLLFYNSGYNPEYRDLSVGIASKVFVLRNAIEERFRFANFLRGDENYKIQFGGNATPVTRIE